MPNSEAIAREIIALCPFLRDFLNAVLPPEREDTTPQGCNEALQPRGTEQSLVEAVEELLNAPPVSADVIMVGRQSDYCNRLRAALSAQKRKDEAVRNNLLLASNNLLCAYHEAGRRMNDPHTDTAFTARGAFNAARVAIEMPIESLRAALDEIERGGVR